MQVLQSFCFVNRSSIRRSFWLRMPFWVFAIAFLSLGLPSMLGNPVALAAPFLADSVPSVLFMAENTQPTIPPAIVDRIRQDLSRRTGKPANQFKVATATQQTWSDGCLGLAQPQEICTQALVSGWRVEMVLGKQQWVYRTNARGSSIRLETGN